MMKETKEHRKDGQILIITNNNFKEVETESKYDEQFKLWRVEVKLKKK